MLFKSILEIVLTIFCFQYTFGDISSKIIDLQKDSVDDSNKSKNTGFGIKESSQSLLSELDKMDAITAESRELKADDLLHS